MGGATYPIGLMRRGLWLFLCRWLYRIHGGGTRADRAVKGGSRRSRAPPSGSAPPRTDGSLRRKDVSSRSGAWRRVAAGSKITLLSNLAGHWVNSKERRRPSADAHGKSMRERTRFYSPRLDNGRSDIAPPCEKTQFPSGLSVETVGLAGTAKAATGSGLDGSKWPKSAAMARASGSFACWMPVMTHLASS